MAALKKLKTAWKNELFPELSSHVLDNLFDTKWLSQKNLTVFSMLQIRINICNALYFETESNHLSLKYSLFAILAQT